MRIVLVLSIMLLLSGCTGMLVGGSASADRSQDCQDTEREEDGREC